MKRGFFKFWIMSTFIWVIVAISYGTYCILEMGISINSYNFVDALRLFTILILPPLILGCFLSIVRGIAKFK
jgi:hypothetical protein